MRFGTNESPIDRIVRVVVGVVLAVLAVTGAVTGVLAGVAWLLAAILVVTGAVGFCPLYALLRIRTNRSAR